ncbi:ArnT family glycosyltransferase [Candidatus Aquicultor sp.]
MLIAAAFRIYQINEPFGGYHGSNEGFYAAMARDYLHKPLLDLFTKPADLNNPPLFTFLLLISFKLFGISESSARLVPVLASITSVIYLYLVAAKLFTKRVGLIAAALFAVSPALVLVGRNVQVDVLTIAFILAGIYYYLVSVEPGMSNRSIASGIFFGLALLTKLPALFALIVLCIFELYRKKDGKRVSKSFLGITATTIIVAFFWYGFEMVTNHSAFITSQGYLAGTWALPNSAFFSNFFINELMWAFNPLTFILVAISLVTLLLKGETKSLLIISIMLVYTVVFAFYHFHSYYLLPVMPFGLILVAKFLDSYLKNRWHLLTAVVIICVVSSFFAILLMAGQKYGHTEFADLTTSPLINKNTTVYVSPGVFENAGTLVKFYLPGNQVITQSKLPLANKRKNAVAIAWKYPDQPSNPESQGIYPSLRSRYSLVLFGISLAQTPPWQHYFANGRIEIIPVGSPFTFGIKKDVVPGRVVLIDLSKLR